MISKWTPIQHHPLASNASPPSWSLSYSLSNTLTKSNLREKGVFLLAHGSERVHHGEEAGHISSQQRNREQCQGHLHSAWDPFNEVLRRAFRVDLSTSTNLISGNPSQKGHGLTNLLLRIPHPGDSRSFQVDNWKQPSPSPCPYNVTH